MSEKNTTDEIDFTSKSSFQNVMKKAKRKQTVKYFIITTITTIFLLAVIYIGSQQIIEKRRANDDSLNYSLIHGANTYQSGSPIGSSDDSNLFSYTEEIAYWKEIGDRSILWDTKSVTTPLFGKRKINESGTETSQFSDREKRYVNFNQLNGEREIEFYFPQLTYTYLPNELSAATELDNNKIVEVALSFKKPLSLHEASKILGTDNVNWLWVDTSTKAQVNNYKKEALKIGNERHVITKSGASAYGFDVLDSDFEIGGQYFLNIIKTIKDGNYHNNVKKLANSINEESSPKVSDISISGAVVTGTPKELERFKNIDIIRASLIGATVDIY
ncbi:anti sigma factor C-terminal domain-containing protein [Peribacillus simplex]|uniref:anti sigma factor C-terminal domain-containing protein n=1 Tax=Peribacillus simplex TaxID=1478 RepID=UPI002E1AC0F9|nr:anti sigma factor C-terminal domain-containing protein [Peribacillus simplex]